jgi:hypothetical protein
MARINEYRMLELGSAAGQQPLVISVTASIAATPVAGAEPTKKASKGDKERKERDKRVKASKRKTWDSARLVHFGGNVDSPAIHRWQRDPPASIAPEPELYEKSEDNGNDDGDERAKKNERASPAGLPVIVEPATDDHQRLIKPRRESVQFDELEKLLEESFAPKTSARRALRSPRITIPGLAPAGTTATTAAAIEGDAPKRKVVGSREVIDRMLDDLLSAAVPTIATTAPSVESTSPGEIAASGPPATTLPAPPAQTPGAATLFVFFVLVLLWWVNNWV